MCKSSDVPHSLLVVVSSCGHDECLCCNQSKHRIRWTVHSASLQSQSAKSAMPVHFRCTWKLKRPVQREWFACLPIRLAGSGVGLKYPVALLHYDLCCRAGFWLSAGEAGVAAVCSQTWLGNLPFCYLKSHSGLESTAGPQHIHERSCKAFSSWWISCLKMLVARDCRAAFESTRITLGKKDRHLS